MIYFPKVLVEILKRKHLIETRILILVKLYPTLIFKKDRKFNKSGDKLPIEKDKLVYYYLLLGQRKG